MIVKIASHTRQVRNDGNAELRDLGLIANAGLHQELRRLNRAKRDDDFQCSFEAAELAVAKNLHPRCSIAFEHNPSDERSRQYSQVGLIHPRVRIRTEHRLAAPVFDNFVDNRATAVGLHHAAACVLKPMETV